MGQSVFHKIGSDVTPRNDQPLEDFLLKIDIKPAEEKQSAILPHNQEVLMGNIGRFPCLTRQERQEMLGWQPQTMQNSIDSLVKAGYLTANRLKRGGQGSGYVAYELTKQARDYMIGRQIHFQKLHGSLEHHCVIDQWVEAKKEIGFTVKRQVPVGEFIFDAMTTQPQKVGLEVVASDNLKRDIDKFPQLLKVVNELEVMILDSDLYKQYHRALKKELPSELFRRINLREF